MKKKINELITAVIVCILHQNLKKLRFTMQKYENLCTSILKYFFLYILW